MKKLMLLVAVTFLAAPAMAEWTEIGKNSEGMTFYLDHSTVKGNGSTRTAWQLGDMANPSPNGDQSVRVLGEFDCKEMRGRTLQVMLYKENMGRGPASLIERQPTDWVYAPPDSVGAATINAVCQKKHKGKS